MDTDTLPNLLKVAVPAGFIAGAITGVLARLAMRALAMATGEEPTFSIGGTIGVITIFAVILGIPLAVIYLRFWPVSGTLPGLASGLLLLLVLVAIPFLVIRSEEATMRLRLIAIATFAPVPLIYGYTLARIAERLISNL